MIEQLDDFDKELAQATLQSTDAWLDIRVGRFTASEMYRLMSHGYREMSAEEKKARPKIGKGSKVTQVPEPGTLGTGAESYVLEKVAETLTRTKKHRNDMWQMEYGKQMEPMAITEFCDRTGYKYEQIGFVAFGDHAGGSPDGVINDIDIVEIKCPSSIDTQLTYLSLSDQYDLKRFFPEYYWQCQSNLLFTGKSVCHFVTYDPRYDDERLRIKHIQIVESKEDQDMIVTKIGLAVEAKLKMIAQIKADLP